MTIVKLNQLLKKCVVSCKELPPLFVLMTGASGAGKSYLAKALEKRLDPTSVHVAYFDQIGVPTMEEMIEKFGSGEKWQEANTFGWLQTLVLKQNKRVIILEGQYRPQFAFDACQKLGISNYILILIHANRTVREHRLINHRKQPDLANETMENWAQFLKSSTQKLEGNIIDTSHSNLQLNLNQIADLIYESLQNMIESSTKKK